MEIRPLRESEVAHHVYVVRTSFYKSNDTNNRILYPYGVTPAILEYLTNKVRKLYAEGKTEERFWLGAFPKSEAGEDPEGKQMMATAYWKIEGPSTYNKELDTWDQDAPPPEPTVNEYGNPTEAPPDSNAKAVEWFFKKIEQTRQRYMGSEETYWHLSLLTTAHEHQRKGAGAALLRWGLEQADAEGKRVWLDATEAGKPLYEKYGFRMVATYELVASRFGDESGRVGYTYGMIREVGGKTPLSN